MPKQPVDIKQFRHAVAVLKKSGLIKNVDARSAEPFMIRGGRSLKETVKKYDDVVSGKVTPVKLPKKKVKEYREAGYKVDREGRAFIPHGAGEKVKINKKTGDVEVTDQKSKFKRIKTIVPYHNLKQWARDMKQQATNINRLKARQAHFGYKLYGNNSWATFGDIRDLLDTLENGSVSGSTPIDQQSHKQANEFYQNLEILVIPTPSAWPLPKGKTGGGVTTKAARKRYLKRVKDTPVGDRIREAAAERQQKYRDKLKGKKKKEYKKDAAKRAKKSRKKNK